MLALGAALMALSIFGFLEIGAYFNRADAPAWTRRGWANETAAILFVFLIGLGTASVIAGLVDAAEQGLGAIDSGLTAAIVLGAFLFACWRRRASRLLPRTRAKAGVIELAASEPALGDAPSPPSDGPAAGGSLPRAA